MKKLNLLLLLIITLFTSQTFAKQALDWNLQTQDGKPITFADYKNKPVILHFWATWCPYCKKLQPKLVELAEKYRESDVTIVAISFNEDEGALPQTSIKERGYDFITAVNGQKVANLYGVRGTPTTFFINKQGNIIFKSTSSNVNDPRLDLAMKEIIK